MKKYQKAELIAKNLPTGSYAAGCPADGSSYGGGLYNDEHHNGCSQKAACRSCERAG